MVSVKCNARRHAMDDELFRTGDLHCHVWCRSKQYTSYDNVYAVNLGKHGDDCIMRVHKVVGSLANGTSFAGFLIDSFTVSGAVTTLQHAYNEYHGDLPRLQDWVVVVADSTEDAILHCDVDDVRHDILNPHPASFCGVYFVSNGNGCVKVGQTTYPLRTRIAQIQAGSPHRLYACATITSGDRRSIEKEIHKSLADRRLHGEWFCMTDQEAIEIARQHGGHAVHGRSKKKQIAAGC
jgi:hypothetical protein